MKKCRHLDSFLENEQSKKRVCGWLENARMPHAVLIVAEDGCGRNLFARLLAAEYLGDHNDMAVRGIHPDCLVAEGEGASGNIPVKTIRELSYELNLSPVVADGRRAAILKNVKNLNKSSANALLKILEEPPKGVVFMLTAASPADVIETVRSRCVTVPLLPLSKQSCAEYISAQYPDFDKNRISELCDIYDGRLGYIKKALASPERLATVQSAQRLCAAAIKRDKLAMMVELDCAARREEMQSLLLDTVMCLKHALYAGGQNVQVVDKAVTAVHRALQDIEKYVNIKLLAAKLAADI